MAPTGSASRVTIPLAALEVLELLLLLELDPLVLALDLLPPEPVDAPIPPLPLPDEVGRGEGEGLFVGVDVGVGVGVGIGVLVGVLDGDGEGVGELVLAKTTNVAVAPVVVFGNVLLMVVELALVPELLPFVELPPSAIVVVPWAAASVKSA